MLYSNLAGVEPRLRAGTLVCVRWPKVSSLSMYTSTTAGWSNEESKFLGFGFGVCLL